MKNSLTNILVKSLTKNEKGYFIKQLSNTDSSYKELFKMIAAQKNSDEKLIITKFKAAEMGVSFSVAKNYLYHSILKSLIQYRFKKKGVHYYFASIELLYQKGLYRNCTQLLKQMIKRSYQTDDYLSILRAIQYIKLLRHSNLNFDSDLIAVLTDEATIIEKQKIVSTFQTLLVEIKEIGGGDIESIDSSKQINSFRKHPYLQSDNKIINKYCEQMYHEILFLSGFLLRDSYITKKHIVPLQKMVINPEYSQNLNDYRKIDVLKQLIRYNVRENNKYEAQNSFQAMKDFLKIANINQSEVIAGYAYVYVFQTDHWLYQKKRTQTTVFFDEVDLFIKKNRELIPKEFFVVIAANILVLCFMQRDYKKVLKLINDLLVIHKNSLRKDIVVSIMLLEIIVFYELEEEELFESRLNAFIRYINNYNIKEKVIELFSAFFIELSHKKEINFLAKDLIIQVDKIKSSRLVLDSGFLIDWVKSKA